MSAATGPVVAACTGRRCSALRALSARPDSAEQLSAAVRDSAGAVLVDVDCPGLCSRSAVAGITGYDDRTGMLGRVWWLERVEQPPLADALVAWVRSGPPPWSAQRVVDVPPALRSAVLGLAPPPVTVPARAPGGT
ncbi:hypothetical protein GB931_04400 [Modestobacter sp. I12A-02628]|uniref:Uncharacterized protein n=1 Tax=Goekera deserti TaxID=2497753 RepID=A0A7K3WGE0_9ACTN|nr:hypothetical protein [Goekera deserti]MPQ97179.1 hypothetical protein [Goekera deserti]NDI46503.1 hypothetical protein [Goekera deserti]NEL54563.1 hypothetical protein [Goekera deserti]